MSSVDLDHSFPPPMVEITQSSITAFLDCKQKYVLRYLMGIRENGKAVPLVLGEAFHAAMEYLMAPSHKTNVRDWNKVTGIIDSIFDKVLETADALWVNNDKMEYARTQCHAMIEAWWIVNGDYRSEYKVKATEATIRASEGATTAYDISERKAGKLDGVIVDNVGNEWLLEHKTRYSFADQTFVTSFDLNQQALFYMGLLDIIQADSHRGPKNFKLKGRAKGFFYNGIAKPKHKLKDGQTYAQLKAQMVQAMLATPEQYFMFIPITMNEEVVERANANFDRIVREMDSLRPGLVTQNFSSCDKFKSGDGGGGCPYVNLCKAGADANRPETVMSLSEIQFYQVDIKRVHQELDDE